MPSTTTASLQEAAAVRSGARSAREAVEAALARIEAVDADLNAWCELRPDVSLAQADAVDARRAAGEDPGPLAGVPIGVKDLEDAAGFRTTFGDPLHREAAPAAADSIEVARLRAAGAVVVGKTNTPAYGFHAETDNLVFGPTRNPWAPGRTAGGSSGGSAAAVASGMVALATGSDGGGSIRIPSEVCGLSGFKPTHGVVPNGERSAPTWGHFSTRGPIGRTLADVAVALDVVKGLSPRDILSLELPGSCVEAVEQGSLAGVRLAWSPTLGFATPDPRVLAVCEAAVRTLERAGASVELVETVFDTTPAFAWGMRAASGSLRLATADPMPWEGRFLPSAVALAELGRRVDLERVLDGEAAGHEAFHRLADLFDDHDLLVCPGMAAPTPRVREESPHGAGWAGEMTLPFNLTRTPAAVVPAGFVVDDGDELPVGLQIVGPRLADLQVLGVAAAAEAALGFVDRRPPIHA